MLAAAVCAGAASEGADVIDLGVLPTPGVAAHCVAARRAGDRRLRLAQPLRGQRAQGARPRGRKLDVAVEASIERRLLRAARGPSRPARPEGRSVGSVRLDDDARPWYVEHLRCGAWAAPASTGCTSSSTARQRRGERHRRRRCSRRSARDVTAIGDEPDGVQHQRQGRLDRAPGARRRGRRQRRGPRRRARRRRATAAWPWTPSGRVLDGDWLLALFATRRQHDGTLGGGVVVTVMSNLGLHHALRDAGIEVLEVPVGDRHVTEALGGAAGRSAASSPATWSSPTARRPATACSPRSSSPSWSRRHGPPRRARRRAPHPRAPGARVRRGGRRDGLGEAAALWEDVAARPARARATAVASCPRLRDRAGRPAHGRGRGRGRGAADRGRAALERARSPSGLPTRPRVALGDVRHHRRRRRRGCARHPARGLERLEYRGYDSAGVAIQQADGGSGAAGRRTAPARSPPSRALRRRPAERRRASDTPAGPPTDPDRVQRPPPGRLRRRRRASSTTASWRTTPRSPSGCARPATPT